MAYMAIERVFEHIFHTGHKASFDDFEALI